MSDGYKLVGVVAQAYHVEREIIQVKKGGEILSEEHLGIGVVFKPKVIAEVLDKVAASQAKAQS